MIADMFRNKKLNPMVTEIFLRGRYLDISLVFIIQFYFSVLKNIKLNSTYYFIMKFETNKSFKSFTFNHSSDFDFEDFMNFG